MNTSNLYTSDKKIKCKFTDKNFVPDANLRKKVWSQADWITFDHDVYCGNSYPQAETRAAALWSLDSIYFAFRCKYSTINVYEGEDPRQERWELWNRDVVEIFINPEPASASHYYEFEVAPNNQWIDLEIDKTKDPFCDPEWASGFQHATKVDSKNYFWTCEMRIPLASLVARPISPGTEWRINFYRADGPGDNAKRRLTSWCMIPNGNSFHTPSRFGLIRFLK